MPAGIDGELPVDVTIELERVEDAVFVGRPAYAQPFTVTSLFKLTGERKAVRVMVRLGRMSTQYAEIVEGLEPGDVVVLSDARAWDDKDVVFLR